MGITNLCPHGSEHRFYCLACHTDATYCEQLKTIAHHLDRIASSIEAREPTPEDMDIDE